MTISRRNFLSLAAASCGAAVFSRSGFSSAFSSTSEAFEFLVIGDSLVWGQGLEEDQKFYRHTKNWLRDHVFTGHRKVNLNVHAHSGSTIKLSPREARALKAAEVDVADGYHPEINVSFPTIKLQVDAARADYPDPGKVDLIMLSGGVPDIGVSNILNPFQSDDKLRSDTRLFCFEHMSELLETTAATFPNALLAVIGYYPIITSHTPVKRIVNDILELYNWPGWTKPLLNNPLQRVLWRRYRRRMIRRSQIWHKDSTTHLTHAIAKLNGGGGRMRAVFVPTPFSEENGYGADKTLLWKVSPDGGASDPRAVDRKIECRHALDELRRRTDLKYRTRVCELASIGHPNADGAAAIAVAIREKLGPLLVRQLPAAGSQ